MMSKAFISRRPLSLGLGLGSATLPLGGTSDEVRASIIPSTTSELEPDAKPEPH